MFSHNKSRSGSALLSTLLEGVVDTSMSVVNIGVETSRIQKSSTTVNELVSTTGAASEEMVSTVKGIADNAHQAAQVAQRTGQNVAQMANDMDQVTEQMGQATAGMTQLQDLSNQIQSKVATISDISDQTNLLALNAAIEAARAGDAGRGFAVVADEVRKLSTQTQKSASEIVDMVQRIHANIDTAAKSVTSSQESIVRSAEGVRALQEDAAQIDHLMSNIAQSTKEQSEASEQISKSILEVSHIAEKNVEQTTNILTLLDALSTEVEKQRGQMAEEPIAHKVLMLAQADHSLWKKKLVDFDLGRLTLVPEDMADHTLCRLGKWYYDAGMKNFKNDEDFQRMEEAHKRVHSAARTAIEERNAMPNKDIQPYIEELESASAIVVDCLQKLLAKERGQ